MYSDDNLELVPRKNDYLIRLSDGQEFGIDQMARGYEVLLCTFAAIMGEMDSATDNAYDYTLPSIVLIDEIETHLHVALQKRVLCMLTELFPNAQFIVTTHSPFVITSLADAIVFDLEKKERLNNPAIYSYEAIVEGYLDVGQYSLTIKDIFSRYKELCAKERSNSEREELQQIISKLELVSPASKELYLAFHTMEDKRKR
jgi:predicted ATP-binding protein involved in virulence